MNVLVVNIAFRFTKKFLFLGFFPMLSFTGEGCKLPSGKYIQQRAAYRSLRTLPDSKEPYIAYYKCDTDDTGYGLYPKGKAIIDYPSRRCPFRNRIRQRGNVRPWNDSYLFGEELCSCEESDHWRDDCDRSGR